MLVLECDPWRAPPSATFMNTMGTSPPAISHRRLISGDHWAMMDEVGHAVIENTISLAMSPVKQKSRERVKKRKEKNNFNTNVFLLENDDQDFCIELRIVISFSWRGFDL